MVQVSVISGVGGCGELGGWPPRFLCQPWTFENGASSKIDDVLAEDGGLLHVLHA